MVSAQYIFSLYVFGSYHIGLFQLYIYHLLNDDLGECTGKNNELGVNCWIDQGQLLVHLWDVGSKEVQALLCVFIMSINRYNSASQTVVCCHC